MRHGYDESAVLAHAIHHAEGEALEQDAPSTVDVSWTEKRAFDDSLDCAINLGGKG